MVPAVSALDDEASADARMPAEMATGSLITESNATASTGRARGCVLGPRDLALGRTPEAGAEGARASLRGVAAAVATDLMASSCSSASRGGRLPSQLAGVGERCRRDWTFGVMALVSWRARQVIGAALLRRGSPGTRRCRAGGRRRRGPACGASRPGSRTRRAGASVARAAASTARMVACLPGVSVVESERCLLDAVAVEAFEGVRA